MSSNIVLDDRRKCLREAQAFDRQLGDMIQKTLGASEAFIGKIEKIRRINAEMIEKFKEQIVELEREEANR